MLYAVYRNEYSPTATKEMSGGGQGLPLNGKLDWGPLVEDQG